MSSSQLELSFDPPETKGNREGSTEPSSMPHQGDAAHPRTPVEPTLITVTSYKQKLRDQVFRRHVKEERGSRCEQCEREAPLEQLSVHHILETRLYPQFARDRRNVLVLCEKCHASVSEGERFGASMRAHFYSRLPGKIRERHVAFVESQIGPTSAVVCAFKFGNSDYWNGRTVDDLTR